MKNVLKSIIAVGIFSLSSPALALDLTSLEVSDRTVVAVDGGLSNSIILVAEENADEQAAGSDAYPEEGAVAENDGNEENAAPEEGAQEEGTQEEGTQEEGAPEEGTQEEGAPEEAPEEGQKSE